MSPEQKGILDQMQKLAPSRAVSPSDHDLVQTSQTLYMARLLALLGEDAAKQSERLDQRMTELAGIAAAQRTLAERLERQTNRLIHLTWGLLALTLVLLLFTVYLSYDAYQSGQRTETAHSHAIQPQ
jgi:hypothetical protein